MLGTTTLPPSSTYAALRSTCCASPCDAKKRPRRAIASLTFIVFMLQFRLRRREPRHRHAIRRARHVIEPARAEEADRVGIASMLAAHADLQLRIRRAAALRADAHELADAFLIDRLERILRQDLL